MADRGLGRRYRSRWKESCGVGGPSAVSDAEKDGIAEKRQPSAHIVTVPKPRFTSLVPVPNLFLTR
jgi:hypothetical protein